MADELLITENELEAIRRRLIAIRRFVTGDNQSEFARKLEIHPNRWNNIERGSPLTLRLAMQIEKQTGLPIEYTIFGQTIRLTPAKRRQLAELERSWNK